MIDSKGSAMHRRDLIRTCAAALLAAGVIAPAAAQLESGDDPEASAVWQKVRASLFGTRAIAWPADDVLMLDAPARAEDAAIVPIAIKTRFAQSATRYIDKLWLVIDHNPSPISAVFTFTPQSGRADIETRVRVDEYTHIRAIAETNDGKLYMTTKFVKASGGCSAPPGKDQATRQYTPAQFVRKVDVSYAGRPVMSADVDFSISENPNFRFYFVPQGAGELKAEVVDSNELHFESALKVRPSAN